MKKLYIAAAILMVCAAVIAQPYGTKVNEILVKIYHIGDYAGGNYANFDQYGRYQAVGDSAVVYGELFVTPTSVKVNPVNQKPDFGYWVFPGQTFSFDASSAESLFFHAEIPHNHKIGTALEVHVHWAPSTTNAGNCAWKLAWMVKDIAGTFAFTASDTLSVRDAGSGVANKHQLVEFGTISMTNVTLVSAIISGVIIRDANLGSDTFTGEARFLDLGFHYQIDALGSKGLYNK